VTALDEHRHRNADAAAVAAIKAEIAERGVKYIYYQFVSVNGRVLAKIVPAHQLERNLHRGVQFHGSAIADLTSSRAGALIGGGAQSGEFTALPDMSSFCVLPWDTEFARFFCTLYIRDDDPERPGEPLPTDCRGVLQRRHDEFRTRYGMELRSGCEPEMSWLGEGMDARPRPGMSPAYHQGTLDMMRPIAKKVISYALAMGLDMVEGDYEDNYQLELNWMFDAADRTADRVLTYRQICRQVARECGVIASFMPKPYSGVMGNGCHHNVSLWRGDVNACADPTITQLHVTDTLLVEFCITPRVPWRSWPQPSTRTSDSGMPDCLPRTR
jgi:glutamine synthetase